MDVEADVDKDNSRPTDMSANTDIGEGIKMECTSTVQKRICLIGNLSQDEKTCAAAQKFKLPVVFSETGSEFLNDDSWENVFVLKEFSGPIYESIQGAQERILGPTALQQYAERGDTLPNNSRPLYNLAMMGLVVCFTGFRKREELTRLMSLIHNMGGSVRKDVVSKVTHLIANCCGGDKYQYAVTFRVPVMSETWVSAAWARREDVGLVAGGGDMMVHKLKPFYGARVCFYGFPDDESQHMVDVLVQNGGEPATLEDLNCSHVVVDSADTYSLLKSKVVAPFGTRSRYQRTPPLSSTPNREQGFDDTGIHLLPTTPSSARSKKSTVRDPNEILSPGSIDAFMTADSINRSSTPKSLGRIAKLRSGSIPSDLPPTNDDSLFKTPTRRNSSSCRRSSLCTETATRKTEIVTPHGGVFKTPNSTPRRKSTLTPKTDLVVPTTTSATTEDNVASMAKTDADFVSYRNERNLDLNATLYHGDIIPPTDPKSDTSTLKSRLKTKRIRRLSLGGFFSRASFLTKPTVSKVEPVPTSPESTRDDSLPVSTRSPGFIPNHSSPMDVVQTITWDNPPIIEEESLELTKTPVVDESRVKEVPGEVLRAPIVKAEWFWVSIQNEGCADEREYLFEDYLESQVSPGSRRASLDTTAFSRARKRKRFRDTVSRLVQNDSPAVHKRRSSVSDAGLLSMSGSFLDSTGGDNLAAGATDEVEAAVSGDTPRKILSPRQQVFLELVQTESNYVGILHTIMMMFKSPLEDMTEAEGPLLNNTELKIIFGNLPPIYEIHRQMLDELRHAAIHWKEDVCIGKILLKYAPDLVKAYPPFVNFFENTKEMLVKCDQTKPRFHAFLKICQTRPECGRQSLQELLIRPVQRLPSISLLLNDILKHTGKGNADHSYLEQALSGIREVMTHINEDKRKTEGQLVMFDIFNDIDNCPPHLVSSHRSFVVRCDVMELSDGLSGRGDNLVFFLFSDTMEVCKKRSRAFNSAKSPNTANTISKLSSTKPYKHVRLLPLSSIKRVIDIRETDECHAVFVLMCRGGQEMKERMYAFTLADQEADKMTFLRTLCRQMANAVCKADAENFLASLDSHQLDIDTSDVALGTLSKALKFASRTRLKIGRTFSFNKTPSKLKRAVSTMMSPFGSTMNLTPSSQLAQMRLASCANLHELGGGTPMKGDLVAPNTVQPTRKNKGVSQSLSMAALRRL